MVWPQVVGMRPFFSSEPVGGLKEISKNAKISIARVYSTHNTLGRSFVCQFGKLMSDIRTATGHG